MVSLVSLDVSQRYLHTIYIHLSNPDGQSPGAPPSEEAGLSTDGNHGILRIEQRGEGVSSLGLTLPDIA